jgi:nitrate/TMAO reductase-like tetraheme cytochrome c subunit
MIMPYKKSILVLLVIVSFIAVGSANGFLNKAKNLKVLPKNISDEALDSIMQSYNVALGVECSFCHVVKDDMPDYASDENPAKDVARKMIAMTIDINKKYFNTDPKIHPAYLNTVRCFTCHKGDAYPQGQE